MSVLHNRKYFKRGDSVILLCGVILVIGLTISLWNGNYADKVLIRSGGKIFKELPLSRDQQITVPGPLGDSVVTIKQRKVRISSDPSPRQYCVRQGWLQQAGEIAVCLPNQISVELLGGERQYDSLNY